MRRRVYGMGGVQSIPRIMRSLPVITPGLFDVPITTSAREQEIYHQQGRLGSLGGLESQGLARTLGSLAGCTLGDEIEMPAECARRGEIMFEDGSCGQDPRRPIDPYAFSVTSKIPVATTKVATSASSVVGKMSKTTMLFAAVGAVGLIYFLGKRK